MKHLDDETLSQLREGDLDEVRAAEARAHLEACGECKARAKALDRLVARLTAPPEEEIPPLLAGRLAETYGQPGDAARRKAWRWIPAVAAAAAVVAVAAVAVRVYAPGSLRMTPGGAPTAERAASPTATEQLAAPAPAPAPAPGAEGAPDPLGRQLNGGGSADKAFSTSGTGGAGPRAVSAADEATSALAAYAGPALPLPMLDTPSAGIDMTYVRAIVSQPGVLAYARRHAVGQAQAWSLRYGGSVGDTSPGFQAPGAFPHETLSLAAANDRLLILTAVARGISGVEAREAIDAARKSWPGMRSGPSGWVSEAPIIWMGRATWEDTGEEVWLVVGIDVFSPIEGAFKVQAVVLDSNGNALVRAGSGAETAAPLR